MNDHTDDKLLRLGAGLTLAYSLLSALCFAGLGGLAGIGLGVGALEARGDDWIGLSIGAGGVVVLVLLGVAWKACVAFVALLAMRGSRPAIIALAAISALGFLSPGLLKTPIGVVTLIGCVLSLDSGRPSRVEEPA